MLGLTFLAAVSLALWCYLVLARGGFWRADQRLPPARGAEVGPSVIAVVPARNEADVVGAAITSLLRQDYRPAPEVWLVDDGSTDGTAEVARAAAEAAGESGRLVIVPAPPRPPEWTGKLWAMESGLAALRDAGLQPGYVLLTDADIRHEPRAIAALVARSERHGLVLCSLMVRLHCMSLIERLMIPAFVFFFQMLYPFSWVNGSRRRTAAAAGGCMLVRRVVLERAGGLPEIRNRLIDDCALAGLMKPLGPIWLGLTAETVSLRPYDGLGAIWRMVARSAYEQLGHAPLALLGTVLGMVLTYLVPPAALLAGMVLGEPVPVIFALATWALMAIAYAPTLRLYGLGPGWAAALPLVALLYVMMTVDSARRHWQGRGGEWKDRLAGGILPQTLAAPRDAAAEPGLRDPAGPPSGGAP